MLAKKKASDRQGWRVTRVDSPVLEEAITAAQGLTDDVECQIEIAAQLMGLPEDEVRPAVLKAIPMPHQPQRMPVADRSNGVKVVVVERRRPRLAAR